MASSTVRASARDMFLTMAVLAIPLVLVTWFFQSAGQDSPEVAQVDWRAEVARARDDGAFPVREPIALPEGWRATKARWMKPGTQNGQGQATAAHTLELGFVSEDEQHFALNQTLAPTRAYVAAASRRGLEQGSVQVAGTPWTHYLSPDGRTHSLVLVEGKVTRMVVSDAGVERLVAFASMLR